MTAGFLPRQLLAYCVPVVRHAQGQEMSRRFMTGLALVLLGGLVSGVAVQTRRTGPILRIVTVGRNPAAVDVDAQTGRAFIANTDSNTVSVLDTTSGALVRTVHVGLYPRAMAVDARTGRVFVAKSGGDSPSVSMLDARSGLVLRTVHVGASPSGLAVDARTGRVFVTTLFGSGVSVLEARTGRIL